MGFCAKSAKILKLVGYVLVAVKIVVPLLIIIFGIVDLSKAVITSDEKGITKAAASLAKRAIAGVIIFFIPTIVKLCFNLVNGFNEISDDFNVCINCVLDPDECDTSYTGVFSK